ncbi:MAG: Ppx/GppA family phosphatase [Ignavibacteriales bacterium]|nr:Ppx/GppA family phosphatase [Ignavibacteriales bacterium]
MRITTIDIGTNTILMLVADIHSDGSLATVRDEHAIARLGKGVDKHKKIPEETFQRALSFLKGYKELSDTCRSEKIIACGTSALRDAVNKKEFISFIAKELGFTIEVLSGDEEAELTYLGAVSDFLQPHQEQNFAVLDIGGGSTELTSGTNKRVSQKQSLDIGCVRLTERILKTSPPSASSVSQAIAEVRNQVVTYSMLPAQTKLVGVAGTLTTLAAIDLNLAAYDRNRVSGHILTLESIQRIFDVLKTKSVKELTAYPQILAGRADVLLAGIIILLEVMKKLNAEQITVSDRGLRYGIALREVYKKDDI